MFTFNYFIVVIKNKLDLFSVDIANITNAFLCIDRLIFVKSYWTGVV